MRKWPAENNENWNVLIQNMKYYSSFSVFFCFRKLWFLANSGELFSPFCLFKCSTFFEGFFFREIVMCLLVPSVIYMYYKVIFAVIDENMCLQLTSNEIYHQYRKALTYSINSSLNSQATAAIPANGILDASIVIWIYHDLYEKLISRTDSSYFYDYTVWFRLVVTCAIFVHLYVLVIGHSLAFQSKTLSNRPAGVRTRNGMSFFSVDMLFNRCHRKNPL